MNDLQRETIAPLRRRDVGVMSHTIARDTCPQEGAHPTDFGEEYPDELWKDIVKQLQSPDAREGRPYGAALPAAERMLGIADLDFSDPYSAASEHTAHRPSVIPEAPYAIQYVQRPLLDYVRGAALAINPFSFSPTPYAHASDLAAMASDWSAVRSDVVEAWGRMIEDDPRLAQALATLLGEGIDGGGLGSRQS